MTETVKTYLMPFFQAQNRTLSVGFLGKELHAAAVSPVADTKVLKHYTDGDSMLRSAFTVSVRFPYGIEGTDGVDTFFRAFYDELHEKNKQGILPEIDENGFAVSVECDLSAKRERCSANSCVYSVKFYLTHYKTNQKGWMI